jgi:hypothetical protein
MWIIVTILGLGALVAVGCLLAVLAAADWADRVMRDD